ncbi:MAG: Multi-copper polyphenol oxidoreductase laccase [Alphaproteobacteria bacterium]|nr:Multi-copper polyphenol oxidoreductase laccase [Alphaproteobacteria bacterium]
MIIETCPLLDDIPWIRHGFFGKENPYAAVKKLSGLHRFSHAFPQVLYLKQTHTDNVITEIDEVDAEADAFVTHKPDLGLAVKTADCCPILLVCTATKQIAAIHAGWRGALNGITVKAIEKMLARGASPLSLIAAIGPNIHSENYPVQADVYNAFAIAAPEALDFLTPFEDRWKLDVAGIIKQQMARLGVRKIWISEIDTFSDPRFSSYRQYQANSLPDLRNVSLILKVNT